MAIPFFFLLVLPVAPHHAPSGWEYPRECCGKGDCFQLANPQENVKWTPNGWLIVETNETIPFEQARVSGDSHLAPLRSALAIRERQESHDAEDDEIGEQQEMRLRPSPRDMRWKDWAS